MPVTTAVQTTAAATREPGRGRRSGATRLRILEAARQQFAAEGFERTTVRSVAAAAKIDPAMVIRYFGNKAGLFTAAAELDLQLPDLSQFRVREIGVALVSHFLEVWEGPRSGQEFPMLLRTATSHADALAKVQAIFDRQLAPAIRAIVPAKAARDTAALISTQLLGLAFSRYVLRLPAVVGLSRKTILETIGPVIQGYVDLGRGKGGSARAPK